VDVEGFEEQVLRGAAKALACESLMAVELEGDSAFVRDTMSAQGFQLCAYDGFQRTLEPGAAWKTGHNHLWIRDLKMAGERCQSAPVRRVGKVEV
jgi:hypothetical protein